MLCCHDRDLRRALRACPGGGGAAAAVKRVHRVNEFGGGVVRIDRVTRPYAQVVSFKAQVKGEIDELRHGVIFDAFGEDGVYPNDFA